MNNPAVTGKSFSYHTNASAFAIELVGSVPSPTFTCNTLSKCVVEALKKAMPRIAVTGFRKAVMEAIFLDCLTVDCDYEAHQKRLLQRARRRFGEKRAHQLFIERNDLLHTWKHRNPRIDPDAYLISERKKTVVCYEVEDAHPMNYEKILKYVELYWNLEYICWDLHLIAYNVYGHPRAINIFEAEKLAIAGLEQRAKRKQQIERQRG